MQRTEVKGTNVEAADQGAKPHLTMANEDYLECIVRIEAEEPDQGTDGIRSVEIAQRLDVSKASVNKAIASLKSQGMVEQAHYGKVRLTEEGRSIGAAVWRRHRMLRAFLTDELGVEFERADEEACKMEHALSEDTMDRWIAHMERDGIRLVD
jgi:DtxR family Mn-dependent transcriptional regulator